MRILLSYLVSQVCSRIYTIAILVCTLCKSGHTKKRNKAFKQKRERERERESKELVSKSHSIIPHCIWDCHTRSFWIIPPEYHTYSILGIEVVAFCLVGCAQVRIRLLCNRASVSLVLCNTSIFVDSTFWLIPWLHDPIYLSVCVFPCAPFCYWSTCFTCKFVNLFQHYWLFLTFCIKFLCHYPHRAPP